MEARLEAKSPHPPFPSVLFLLLLHAGKARVKQKKGTGGRAAISLQSCLHGDKPTWEGKTKTMQKRNFKARQRGMRKRRVPSLARQADLIFWAKPGEGFVCFPGEEEAKVLVCFRLEWQRIDFGGHNKIVLG